MPYLYHNPTALAVAVVVVITLPKYFCFRSTFFFLSCLQVRFSGVDVFPPSPSFR